MNSIKSIKNMVKMNYSFRLCQNCIYKTNYGKIFVKRRSVESWSFSHLHEKFYVIVCPLCYHWQVSLKFLQSKIKFGKFYPTKVRSTTDILAVGRIAVFFFFRMGADVVCVFKFILFSIFF